MGYTWLPPTGNRPFNGHLTLNIILANIVMGLSVFSFGFDNVTYNTIQAMTPFEKRFGYYDKKEKAWDIDATHLAYLNSMPLLVYAVALLLANQIGERYGRRSVLILMNVICLIGTIISYTATSFGQILAGRCLVNAHIGMEAWLIPMLQAEIVPAAIRGKMVMLYIFDHQFGAFICAIIAQSSAKLKTDMAWKTPLAVGLVFPSLVLLLHFFVPESPRWLLRKGRFDEAVKSLDWLHGSHQDYSAVEEAKLLHEALEESEIKKGTWSDLFRGSNRRRTLMAMTASMLSILAGNSFSSSYGTVFIKQVGGFDAFTGTLIKKGIVVLGPITDMILIDWIGRRKTFITMGALAAAALLAMGGLGCHTPFSMPYKKGVVAMTIFFPYARIASFGAVGTLMAAEVPNMYLRDKTAFAAWLTSDFWDFVSSFTMPYLLKAPYADLGSKVGFIYGSFSVVGVIWMYFYLPDLRGKSLEEIDEFYESGVPAWKAHNWKPTDPNSVGHKVTQLENENHIDEFDKLGERSVDGEEIVQPNKLV